MAMLFNVFTTGDIASLARVTYRQISHWVKTGLIVPEKDTSGTGDHRIFNFRNVVEARVIKELRDRGISLQKIRRCVEFLRKYLPNENHLLSKELLLTDGTSIYWCRNEKEVVDTLRKGQAVFAIMIADLWNETRAEVQPIIEALLESDSDNIVQHQVAL